jgi:o-succinylbenzoate synthase
MKNHPDPYLSAKNAEEREFSFSWREYSRSFAKPLETAHGRWVERRGVIVRLETPDGGIGYGEISPVPYFSGPDVSSCVELCGRFGSKVLRMDLSNHELPSCVRFAFGSAMAMADDLLPKKGRWPLARLLPRGSSALFEAGRRIRMGCRCFKYKICGMPDEDERHILEMLFESLHGVGGRLRIDANESLSIDEAGELITWIAKIGGHSLDYVEQPLPRGKEGGMLELMRSTGSEIALDESVSGMEALKEWLFWPGPIVVKPALAGDPLEVAKLLDARNARVILSSSMESPVGLWGCLMAIGARVPEPLGFGVGVWPEWDAWGEFTSGVSLESFSVTNEDMEAVWNGLLS